MLVRRKTKKIQTQWNRIWFKTQLNSHPVLSSNIHSFISIFFNLYPLLGSSFSRIFISIDLKIKSEENFKVLLIPQFSRRNNFWSPYSFSWKKITTGYFRVWNFYLFIFFCSFLSFLTPPPFFSTEKGKTWK